MQKRNYKRVEKNSDNSFSYQNIDIDSYDIFEEPLEIVVTDINFLPRMGDILDGLGLYLILNIFSINAEI